MKLLDFIIRKWKVLFCYFLFLISILFSVVIFVIKPMKVATYFPYEYSDEEISVLDFPVIQHFNKPKSPLKTINIYFRDEYINQFDYTIDIYSEKSGKKYFSHNYHHYNSNIVSLDTYDLSLSDDESFILKIDCKECKNVSLSLKNSSIKSGNYIEGGKQNKMLEMNYLVLVPNKSYYWYSIVGILVSLILYPLAKEEK